MAEINHQHKTFIVGTFYRPPGMSAAEVNTSIAATQPVINHIITENPETFFLLGDINAHCCNHWDSELKKQASGLGLFK